MLKVCERASGSGTTFARDTTTLGRIERAVALWSQKCQGQADRVQFLIWQGRIHLMTNERRECTAFFRQALELAPDYFEARLYLTAALIDFDAREAVEHLEILCRRDSQNS